jgi:hypothetical protein
MKTAIALTLVLCAFVGLEIRHRQRELDSLRAAKAAGANPAEKASASRPSRPAVADAAENTRSQAPGTGSALAAKASAAAADPAELARIRSEEAALNQKIARGRQLEAINSAYGPLVQRLKLDPDTAAQFTALVSQERLTAADAVQAEKAQGVAAVSEYLAAVREAVGGVDQQLSSLLGPDNFEAFTAYRNTLPEEGTVAQLSTQLANTPAPLSDAQQTQLVLLINQMETPNFRLNEDFLGMVGMQAAPLTPTMVQAAEQVLSPPQAAAFQTLVEMQQARVAAENQLRAPAK